MEEALHTQHRIREAFILMKDRKEFSLIISSSSNDSKERLYELETSLRKNLNVDIEITNRNILDRLLFLKAE